VNAMTQTSSGKTQGSLNIINVKKYAQSLLN
jgi:hypothetical protein